MNTTRNPQLESQLRQALRALIGETRYTTWFANVRFDLREDALLVKAPNDFYAEWLRSTFAHSLNQAVNEVLGIDRLVRVVSEAPQTVPGSPASAPVAESLPASETQQQPPRGDDAKPATRRGRGRAATPPEPAQLSAPSGQATFFPFPPQSYDQRAGLAARLQQSQTFQQQPSYPAPGYGYGYENHDADYANRVLAPAPYPQAPTQGYPANFTNYPQSFVSPAGYPQQPALAQDSAQQTFYAHQASYQPAVAAPAANLDDAPDAPPKRKRGRPRKNPLPGQPAAPDAAEPVATPVAAMNPAVPAATAAPNYQNAPFSFADAYNRTLLEEENAPRAAVPAAGPDFSDAERASLTLGDFNDGPGFQQAPTSFALPQGRPFQPQTQTYQPTIDAAALAAANDEGAGKEPRRRGRPKGSTNRKTAGEADQRQANEVSRDANGYNIVTAPREKPRVKAVDVSRRRFASLRTFVVGPSNSTPYKIADLIVSQPGMMNPLYLSGPTSVGKTHLLEGICDAYSHNPEFATKPPLYMTAEQFTTAFIHSFQGNAPFRDRFRNISLFALDDLQFLEGKKSTQTELVQVIDHLRNLGVQIAISGNKPIQQFTDLRDELVTRIQSGVNGEIAPPERETLAAILQRMAIERNLYVPEEVCRYVVSRFATHAREISGALNRLYVAHLQSGEAITLDFARAALASLAPAGYRNIRLEDVEQIVQTVFSLESNALKSSSRAKKYADPRAIAMWLARKHTRAALAEIGAYFGGRRHSAVLIAQRKVDGWLQENATVAGIDNPYLSVVEVVKAIERELTQTTR